MGAFACLRPHHSRHIKSCRDSEPCRLFAARSDADPAPPRSDPYQDNRRRDDFPPRDQRDARPYDSRPYDDRSFGRDERPYEDQRGGQRWDDREQRPYGERDFNGGQPRYDVGRFLPSLSSLDTDHSCCLLGLRSWRLWGPATTPGRLLAPARPRFPAFAVRSASAAAAAVPPAIPKLARPRAVPARAEREPVRVRGPPSARAAGQHGAPVSVRRPARHPRHRGRPRPAQLSRGHGRVD